MRIAILAYNGEIKPDELNINGLLEAKKLCDDMLFRIDVLIHAMKPYKIIPDTEVSPM